MTLKQSRSFLMVVALAIAQGGCGSPQVAAISESLSKQPCQVPGLDGPTLYVGPDGRTVSLTPAECEAKKRDDLVTYQQTAQARVAVRPELPPSPQPQEYKANWKKVEADNGQVYHIDLNSIYRSGHGATAVIYVQEGTGFTPLNLHNVLFACPDYMTILEGSQSAMYLPPRSIGRRLADIACAGVPPHH